MANFEINEEQAALNRELRKLETSDPVHADVYNALFGKLINNDAFLERLANKMIEKSMLCHVLDSVNTQQVLAADVGPKITKITDGLQKSISGLNTDLSNRFASRVADCNFLTEGKSETVVMAIWDNNTLNTPYKQGVSGFGNGFVIGMSLELAWAIQVAFAVSDTNLFVRSYTLAGIGWTGWRTI